MEAITELFAPGRWPTFALVTARLSGWMAVAPLWSMTTVPARVRAPIVVVLAMALLPAIPAGTVPDAVIALPLALALEMLVGLAVGLLAAAVVSGVALAGEVISLQSGLSLGPALAPLPELQGGGLAQFQGVLGLVVFVSVDGHLGLLRALHDSFVAIPPGAGADLAAGAAPAMHAAGELFDVALRSAAPVLVTLLLVQVAMAFLARAVPNIHLILVSMPVTIGVGLLVLGLALPTLADALGARIAGLEGRTAELVRAIAPAPGTP